MEQEIKVPHEAFHKNLYQKFVLAADIGGNHSHSAIFGVKDNKTVEILFKNSIFTKDIESISIFLNHNLKMAKELYDIDCDTAAIGVAGPLKNPDRQSISLSHHNLTIKVHEMLLGTLLKKITLLNDFEAIGYGIDFLKVGKDMIEVAHKNHLLPPKIEEATACVIGAGYGLGSSILPFNKKFAMHVPIPCEGGHMAFAPETPEDTNFQQYIQEKIMKNSRIIPSFERFVSGRGITDLWHHLRKKKLHDDTEIEKQVDFLIGNEKIKTIAINYYNDQTCKKTMDLFMKYYAQFARNLALVSVCYGGLFIAGGIAVNHIELFQAGDFMNEFLRSDQKQDILEKVPVFIISNRDVGLYGACNVAVNFSETL